MKEPILITGIPRSGTSMVAGMFSECGAFKGWTDRMFENIHIRQRINKAILASMLVDENGQFPLPDLSRLPNNQNWAGMIENLLTKQGYDNDRPWIFKDSRMLLLFPIWKTTFPAAKWVIVLRDEQDIINSCKKTAYMRAFEYPWAQNEVGATNEAEGWAWWIKEYQQRIQLLSATNENVRFVFPEKFLIQKDYSEIKEVVQWTGLNWDDQKIKNFIQPKFWKGVKNGKD